MQEKNRAIEIIERYKDEGLISVLEKLEEAFNYLSEEIIAIVSTSMKIPISRIYSLITFYTRFSLKPSGKYTIRVCKGISCHVKGQEEILRLIKRLIGIKEGETSPDFLFTLETVACVGACALAPVIVINNEYFGKMDLYKVESIINRYKGIKKVDEDRIGK